MVTAEDIEAFRDEPIREDHPSAGRPLNAFWLDWACYTLWASGFGAVGDALLKAAYPVDGTNGERSEQ